MDPALRYLRLAEYPELTDYSHINGCWSIYLFDPDGILVQFNNPDGGG